MTDPVSRVTYLFSDIEGSTLLWEAEPQRMHLALARHDALVRAAVERHRGSVVKMTGDGVHAAFDSPLDALLATLEMQHALAAPRADGELELRVRCGLHAGSDERRDGDYFGPAVNRAARIMSAAHGGQILLSQAVAAGLAQGLPDGVALRDLGALRLRDLASPERVFQVVAPPLRTEFPALRALESTPNNLPQQLNSFIGRERELQEVKQLLRKCRLLTLLGMGGIGKSRLSLQLAADLLDNYPDGAWLVELAALHDPRMVAAELATVLGVKEEPGRPLLEALMKFVRERRLLIILDNCEHLVAACADLAKRLLQAGPLLQIVATSRDYLQTSAEIGYHVPTLSVPDPTAKLAPDALAEHEAVRLFIERASASQPSFFLTTVNASAVVDICCRLDGIPLAIELAAARMRGLSVESIAARLGDRFRLLATGDTTVLPRQRTLRALIDWSYDLLPPHERMLFQRLAVFSGGWTLEAAEAVGQGDGIGATDVLEALTRLTEKSLVVIGAGGARYQFLDTVRHYVQQKMVASGDASITRARHADYFLALAEQAQPELGGPAQGRWLARLDLERENFLSAHDYGGGESADPELGVRLLEALRAYWIRRGLLTLGLRLAEEVLARAGVAPRTRSRCGALFGTGQICYFMGRYSAAIEFLSEALAIARELDDGTWIAAILQPLGTACLGNGEIAAARGHLEEALVRARELDNRREIAAAGNALAMVHRLGENWEQAEQLYIDVVMIARQLDDRESIAIGLLNLAMVSINRGCGVDARRMLLEVVEIAEHIGSTQAGQSALEVCAALASANQDWVTAARLFGVAEAATGTTAMQRDPADAAFLQPWIDKARISLGAKDFAAAESAGRALALEDGLAQVRRWLSGNWGPSDATCSQSSDRVV